MVNDRSVASIGSLLQAQKWVQRSPVPKDRPRSVSLAGISLLDPYQVRGPHLTNFQHMSVKENEVTS
jgi:hypothetical protein